MRQEDDMRQVPYCGLINTVLDATVKKFCRHGDLELRFCVSLFLKAYDAAYFSVFYYTVLSLTPSTQRQVTAYRLEVMQRKEYGAISETAWRE